MSIPPVYTSSNLGFAPLVATALALQSLGMAVERLYADVGVVGAGLAGLAVARELTERGFLVTVLEARGRIGGRLECQRFPDGLVVDLGGQWHGPGQNRIIELSRRLGVASYATYTRGRTAFEFRGHQGSYRGQLPWSSPLAFMGAALALSKLGRLAKRVQTREGWGAQAARLDAQSVGEWIRAQVWPESARSLVRFMLECMFCCDIDDVSLLLALHGIARCGSLEHMLAVQNGAQERQFVGGTEQLLERLAAPLTEHGRIRFDSPVQRVERGTQAVRLTGVGFELTAKRAVITIPPPLVMNIHFSPALEPERARLIAAFRMGSVFKAIVVYARPFWRDGRSNGQLWQASGPLAGTYDITPENSAHGVLAVLSAASAAESLRRQAPAERRVTVLAAVAQHFGSAAQSPLYYAERCWSEEPWSGGGYAAHLGPGHFAHGLGALRIPCGNLHWAGTETALEWPGYMEGALESAERVLAELSNAAP